MDKFKTIKENVEAEIVEKKSKFIASGFKITTSEEAKILLKLLRKNILMQDIIVMLIV